MAGASPKKRDDLLSQRKKQHIHIYSGFSILFHIFPYFFHWMSHWMSLPATWIFQRPPQPLPAGGSEFTDGRCLDTHAEPRWSSDLGSVQCGDQAPRRCGECRGSCRRMWARAQGPFKKGLKRGKNTCWVMDFKEFLLFSAMGHWNILEYIGIWVIYDGNYIDLDGLLWCKNCDIYGGRVRYWWDMNGR